MGFYSRPQDVQSPAFEETTAHLPFSTLACNRNSLVAVGDESGNVRITESAKDEHPGFLKPYITLKCHDNAIFDMAWSPDDHLLATASGDQGCNIMDMIQQRQLFSLRGHDNSVKQIMFNPHNPHILASSSRDGKLNIWDLRVSGLRVQEQQGILTVLQPVQSIQNAHTLGKTPTSVTSVVWTQEYRVATAGQTSAAVKVWDLKSSLSRKKQPLPVETSALPVHHQGHRDFGISCLTLSPDSQRLYAVCKDSNVYAYSTNHLSQGPIHAYNHPKLMVSTFFVKSEISRDGRFLATGSSNGTPILFPTDEKYFDKRIYTDFSRESSPLAKNMQVGRGIALVRGHEKEVTDVTWTIEGDLVTISDDCNARCWRSGVEGEAHSLREGGEHEGRRWMWGWAEMD
ncbi:WD40-repeat-containing domain protein [Geopyxis carbonaria]|nr:WD40-repeat-containing domain protein [Geopyxis carbonaria]